MVSQNWKYEPSTRTIRATPSNHWIATMDSWDGAVNNEANARLIASAPELLAALELCWQATGEAIAGDVEPDKLRTANRAARAAILKATVGSALYKAVR